MARINSSPASTIKPAEAETKDEKPIKTEAETRDEKPVKTENDSEEKIIPDSSEKKVIKTIDKKIVEKKSAAV